MTVRRSVYHSLEVTEVENVKFDLISICLEMKQGEERQVQDCLLYRRCIRGDD